MELVAGEIGLIEGSFGQSGKVKLRFPGNFNCTLLFWIWILRYCSVQLQMNQFVTIFNYLGSQDGLTQEMLDTFELKKSKNKSKLSIFPFNI